jgi:hypothetical protein
LSLFFLASVALASPAAQSEERFLLLRLENGESLGFTLTSHPPDAHLLAPGQPLEPRSALETAKLVTRHLAEGRIEEASLLSTAPKTRYGLLQEATAGWTEEDFRKTYGSYFAPENRIVGEVAVGEHRLLMWHLKDIDHVAAFYLVDVEGRMLIDDAPNPMRANLRKVLEAYRSGKIAQP